MKYTGILIVLASVFFTGQTCADRGTMYDYSLAKWKNESAGPYYIRVNFRAFSPHQGQWELEVKEGQVVRASFKGAWDDKYVKPAERFTVDSIFKTAGAVKSGDTGAPMIVTAEFSDTIPYIKSVTRMNNEKFDGNLKKDAGFSIIVLEFERR